MDSSQFWSAVSAIVSILALLVTIARDREKLMPLGTRIFVSIVCAIVGIMVMAIGPLVQGMFFLTLNGGFSAMWNAIVERFTTHGPQEIFDLLSFGLLPGTITAMVALSGKNRSQRIRRAIVAAIISLMVVDTLIYATSGGGSIGVYLFAILSNVIGGPIAGYVIGFVIQLVVNQFESSETSRPQLSQR